MLDGAQADKEQNRSRHTPQILLRKTFLLGDSLRKTRKDVRD